MNLSTEARLWIAMGLSTIVIVAYTLWMQRHPAATVPPAAAVAAAGQPAAPPVPPVKEDARAARRHRLAAAGAAPAPRAAVARTGAAEEVTVESETVRGVFSARGGRLLSWQLKDWKATGSTLYEELVPLRAAMAAEGPLSVVLSDDPDAAAAPATASLSRLVVAPREIRQTLPGRSREEAVVPIAANAAAAGLVTFTTALPHGRTLVKRIRVPAAGYEVGVELELTGPAPETLEVVWAPGLGLSPEDEERLQRAPTYQNVMEARVLTGRGLPGNRQDLLKQGPAKQPAEKEGAAPFWSALKNKYFVVALVPPATGDMEGVTGVAGAAATAGAGGGMGVSLKFSLVPGAARVRIPLRLYAGPQEFEGLHAAGDRLEKTMDFGFFGVLALPMLKTLVFLGRFTRNYGVAIIMLTLIVRGLLWLPSQWGLNQMKRLQAVKPQIDFIMKQYENDPQRKQEEMMRIYRENQVNPVGGCLPMLLQIPVFFALYSALSNAVELRGAPFALWVRDLSVRDPLYVLPALVAGTMFWQQVITPVVGDPEQAKMMKWMSLAFAFMFFKMPSGLMVYWLAQNLFQIAQQYRTNRSVRAAT